MVGAARTIASGNPPTFATGYRTPFWVLLGGRPVGDWNIHIGSVVSHVEVLGPGRGLRLVGFLILNILCQLRFLGPLQVVRDRRLREPIVRIRRLNKAIGPAFGEEPPGLASCDANSVEELIAVNLFDVLHVARLLNLLHNPGFRSVDLDVSRFGAVSGVVRVGAADVRDLQHHVRLPLIFLLAVPEADADVLHTIA